MPKEINFFKLNKRLVSLKDVLVSEPYEEGLVVYVTNDEMFALVTKNKDPINLSLRCDKNLGLLLQKKYESVMSGHRLNKNKWITLVLSGQLSLDDIYDLIVHSYNLAKEIK
ncbi:MAG TPA: MmcQ/YjbR family DNA-binding protein [Candidatus Saccharimonadia bacterium]|nr:MmcQ/YjbR family DNA-binding protein [Candidatus Saccharimonadia bacterium]